MNSPKSVGTLCTWSIIAGLLWLQTGLMAGGKLGRGAGRLTGVDLDWAGVVVVAIGV